VNVSNEAIARTCHEVNRAYCKSIGDDSQPSWEDAPEWQKTSAINGVKFHRASPDPVSPEKSHESWLKEKEATGWKFGLVKDPEKKEHPCMVPYADLPEAQRKKDMFFGAIVEALAPRGQLPEVPGNQQEPITQFFKYGHLPEAMQLVSKPFHDLAHRVIMALPRNPERTVALRKLLEAKDAAVRATIFQGL
jgi:hypothetical protein